VGAGEAAAEAGLMLLVVLFALGAASQLYQFALHVRIGGPWRCAADLSVAALCTLSAFLNLRLWKRDRRRAT
jgi:hypothetical protein